MEKSARWCSDVVGNSVYYSTSGGHNNLNVEAYKGELETKQNVLTARLARREFANKMAHRKLQQEVDRVFKKISEGMDSFNESYERHELSNSQTQRDKLENDLKKEIKKLQRLREQIKVWQTQNEIKDKDALLKHRKLVEAAMEKYKQVEKESKHKAYSREGLTQPEQLSPAEQEKQDTVEYVNSTLEVLQIQLEALEAELARLSAGGRKSKKGGLGPKDQERKSELDDLMDAFKFHQQSLELVLRLLQNGKLEPELFNELKEDIQYFIENNQDPDFMFDDSIYEPLGLEERDNLLVHEVKSSFDVINGADHDNSDSNNSHQSPSPVIPPLSHKTATTKRTSPAPLNGNSATANGKATAVLSGLSSASSTTSGVAAGPIYSYGTSSGLPSTATLLKPAPMPLRSINEKKWAVAAATSLNNGKSRDPPPTAPLSRTATQKKLVEQNGVPTSAPAPTIISNDVPNGKADIPKEETMQPQPQKEQPAETLQSTLLFNNVKKPEQQVEAPLHQNEIEFRNDLLICSIPPGIQSFIGSFIQSRNKEQPSNESVKSVKAKGAVIKCSKDLLVNFRKQSILGPNSNLHPTEFLKLNSEWDAFRCLIQYDSKTGKYIDLDTLLMKTDVIILFFGFYYGLTFTERQVAQRGLYLKNWRLHNNKIFWFYKLTPATATTQKFEIANYEVFDALNWSVKILNNYQLDLSQIVSVTL